MGKIWVALLLLLSTLSSQPLGSMEQGAHAETQTSASALPLARAADGSPLALFAPDDAGPAPGPAACALPVHPARVARVRRRPAPRPDTDLPDPRLSPPERLPYFATAPPVRAAA